MMVIASLALAGIYPFAGFFSKDLILEVAFTHNNIIWIVLLLSAIFTAFYSFRLLMLVFFVKQNHHEHPHEAYSYMLLAMLPLMILAIIAGFGGVLESFLKNAFPAFSLEISHDTHILLIGGTLGLVGLSVLFAIIKYARGGFSAFWESNFLYKILSNQYYIPKLYEIIFIKPYYKCAHFLWQKVEFGGIDRFVDSLALLIRVLGLKLSLLQNGSLSRMLLLMCLGLCAMLFACGIYFMWR